MSNVDRSRAYLALRELIAQVREEFGDEQAWILVEMAVIANLKTFKEKQYA